MAKFLHFNNPGYQFEVQKRVFFSLNSIQFTWDQCFLLFFFPVELSPDFYFFKKPWLLIQMEKDEVFHSKSPKIHLGALLLFLGELSSDFYFLKTLTTNTNGGKKRGFTV